MLLYSRSLITQLLTFYSPIPQSLSPSASSKEKDSESLDTKRQSPQVTTSPGESAKLLRSLRFELGIRLITELLLPLSTAQALTSASASSSSSSSSSSHVSYPFSGSTLTNISAFLDLLKKEGSYDQNSRLLTKALQLLIDQHSDPSTVSNRSNWRIHVNEVKALEQDNPGLSVLTAPLYRKAGLTALELDSDPAQAFKALRSAVLTYNKAGVGGPQNKEQMQCFKLLLISQILAGREVDITSSFPALLSASDSDPSLAALLKIVASFTQKVAFRFKNELTTNQSALLHDPIIHPYVERLHTLADHMLSSSGNSEGRAVSGSLYIRLDKEVLNTAECAICLDGFEGIGSESLGNGVRLVYCDGHCFHLPCIRDWLGRSQMCPVCRHVYRL